MSVAAAHLDTVLDHCVAGSHVYLPGSAGAPSDLVTALELDPERSRGVSLTTSFVPGINTLDLDRLHPTARVSGLFMQPGFRNAQRDGRFRHMPMSYHGFVKHVDERLVPTLAVVTVSLPDDQGRVSLGAAVEFTPQVLARATRRVAVVNANMPFVSGAPTMPLAAFDLWVESSAPIPIYEPGTSGGEALAIARHIATLVRDGAALQVGLGKVPDALFGLLHDRRRLRLHSGMLSDGAIALAEKGLLDPDFRHVTCVLVGSRRLYDWSATQDLVAVQPCSVTHDPRNLAAIDGLVAVNSALTVDLLGQCDLETAGGRAVSGVGGAPDFARGARQAPGGLSIVALPSTYAKGGEAVSRIVPRLGAGHIASIARTDVDVIVTEHGIADLRGRSVPERAEALIAIAAPAHQPDLMTAWRAIQEKL
ncbi:MAG: hypothetical protein KF735_17270 [Chelatococcus sp.]|uniref:acetyl-CoA hydrolase/transferase family protein n=1 Tax=Chelatococcus sp. TaxID=1953771 RepID=UPI0025C4A043|nr:acetyl-CoA hydrolase/transferase C-terminal domain-containing protein [Chelatococcus sp.]MBX3539399.1 hypothetical protein [Chelatococcus sp.]